MLGRPYLPPPRKRRPTPKAVDGVPSHSSARSSKRSARDSRNRPQFQGENADLADLQGKIESYLKSEEFTIQTSPPGPAGTVIQAKKGGFLSAAIAADRALNNPDLR